VNRLTLQLRVKKNEGALARILGVTRRRRFEVISMKVFPSDDGGYHEVQMTVEADRPGSTLVNQIQKLEDVSEVEAIDLT
jgi:acetolactate synthase II small subunit